jgi:hypothetical protein
VTRSACPRRQDQLLSVLLSTSDRHLSKDSAHIGTAKHGSAACSNTGKSRCPLSRWNHSSSSPSPLRGNRSAPTKRWSRPAAPRSCDSCSRFVRFGCRLAVDSARRSGVCFFRVRLVVMISPLVDPVANAMPRRRVCAPSLAAHWYTDGSFHSGTFLHHGRALSLECARHLVPSARGSQGDDRASRVARSGTSVASASRLGSYVSSRRHDTRPGLLYAEPSIKSPN